MSEQPKTQTEIRLAMLDMGYEPLPNHDKRCMLKGWSTIPVTREAIQSWDDKLIYRATGLRLVPGLCAFDVDVKDAAFVAELWDRCCDEVDDLGSSLIRHGKNHKEMWLFRVTPGFGIMNSIACVRPDEDPDHIDAEPHRVEVFGGTSGRQFGVYGAHSLGRANKVEVEYRWEDGMGPAEVPFSELPELPKASVVRMLEIANEMFEELGWHRVKRVKAGEVEEPRVYDLTDEMGFDCNDGVTRGLDELADFAQSARNPRCSASWLEGPQARNTSRCIVILDHTGTPGVFETANAQTHLPVGSERTDPIDKMRDLAEKFAAKGHKMPDDEEVTDEFEAALNELLDGWAYCASRTRPCLPIFGIEEASTSVANLRLQYASKAYEKVGPRGGTTKVNPVDVWVAHDDRLNADGYRFMPSRKQGIHSVDGELQINSYKPPLELFVPVNPALQDRYRDLFTDLIRHLLPDPVERNWFIDWLAYKYQHLDVPSVGVLMVAPTHGVGRGSLFEILQYVFGRPYVRAISASTLLGDGSQSQYTDWQAQSLLVTVDEVLQDGDDGGAVAWRRKKAYERLKERVDPKARVITVTRKGLPNYSDVSYATYLLATNHPNALPIDEKDRRIAVLTNNPTDLIKAPGQLYERLNEVRDPDMDPGFIACVRDLLRRHRVAADYSPYEAPKFEGRQLMIDHNKGMLDEIVDDVLERLPFDWVTRTAFEKRVEKELIRHDSKQEIRNWRRNSSDMLANAWTLVGRENVNNANKRAMVYARNHYAASIFKETDLATRAEQLRQIEDVNTLPTPEVIAARSNIRLVKP